MQKIGNIFGNTNQLQSMYRALSQSNNPYDLFVRLAGNNPQLQPIVKAIKNGGNPQQVYNEICNQKGINPDEFLKNITGNNT